MRGLACRTRGEDPGGDKHLPRTVTGPATSHPRGPMATHWSKRRGQKNYSAFAPLARGSRLTAPDTTALDANCAALPQSGACLKPAVNVHRSGGGVALNPEKLFFAAAVWRQVRLATVRGL